MRHKIPVRLVIAILLCVCLSPQFVVSAQMNKSSSKSKNPHAFATCGDAAAKGDDLFPPSQLIEMLTPAGGIDFGPYVQGMMEKVKRSWCALRPGPDLNGGPFANTPGSQVVIEFTLNSDGELLEKRPMLEQASDSVEVNNGALGAILKAAPFGPLPADFQSKSAKFRVTFTRNMGVFYEDRKKD